MLSRFLNNSLIGILLFCLIGTAQADPTKVQLSGFMFGTYFTQNEWYDSRTVGTINLDVMYEHIAIRSQVNTIDNGTLRRLTLEKDVSVGTNSEVTFKVGRFARVNSFYDSVTDSPASSNMAILPQAGYSYRMFNGSFALMDGIQIVNKYHNSDALYYSVASYGQMVISNQKELIQEIFKQDVAGIKLNPNFQSVDLSLHMESGPWHLFYAHSDYEVDTLAENNTATTRYLVSTYHNAEYRTNKVGAKWEVDAGYVQAEYLIGEATVISTTGVTQIHTTNEDYNIVLGKTINNEFTAYTSYSRGLNLNTGKDAVNRVIGVTYAKQPLTVSVERDIGHIEGGWAKYESNGQLKNINSYVMSVTYQF